MNKFLHWLFQTSNSLLFEYKNIFLRQGCSEKFQIDYSVQPCVQKSTMLLFLLRKQLENETQKLLELDFIESLTSSPK